VKDNLVTAEQYAVAQANGAITTAEGFTTTIGKTLTTDINAVAFQASQALTGAEATLGGEITTAEQTAATATKALTTTVTTDIGAVTGDIGTEIGQALGGVYDDITGAAQAVSGDLSSIEGLLAGAITASIAGVLARVVALEKCSVSACEGGNNNFGDLLKAALGFAEFAGVGAFLAQLIDNPAGAEAQYAGLIQGAWNDGQHGLDALLSL
jgi:hypothetical protein